ncbi:MAG: hypothetical protein GX416_04955 [Bacteroidales bacterium]|nr:hypothetical protein [Bacteroidales bacterium]
MQESSLLLAIVRLMLPAELLTYFKITNVESTSDRVLISLDEFDNPPSTNSEHKFESKGFQEAVDIRDFPIRDKKVTFKVRRRKWLDKTSGKYVSNRFDLVAEGTRHSKEFAAFLKGLLGEIPDYGPLS